MSLPCNDRFWHLRADDCSGYKLGGVCHLLTPAGWVRHATQLIVSCDWLQSQCQTAEGRWLDPRPAFMLESPKYETITPIPYDIIKEGIQN